MPIRITLLGSLVLKFYTVAAATTLTAALSVSSLTPAGAEEKPSLYTIPPNCRYFYHTEQWRSFLQS